MYQQRTDPDSASLEGMEEVFAENSASVSSGDDAEGPEPEVLSLPQVGNRILRGTYNQGLLLLREEELKPLAISPQQDIQPNRQSARILYSNNKPDEPIRSFESELLGGDSTSLAEPSIELFELIKRHAEQAKVANELIKHLTKQLEEQKKYIERLRGDRPQTDIWTRIKQWFGGR